MAGLEPARPYGQQILSLLWLPLHHIGIVATIAEVVGLEPTQHLRA
jgi:hypothetical protein